MPGFLVGDITDCMGRVPCLRILIFDVHDNPASGLFCEPSAHCNYLGDITVKMRGFRLGDIGMLMDGRVKCAHFPSFRLWRRVTRTDIASGGRVCCLIRPTTMSEQRNTRSARAASAHELYDIPAKTKGCVLSRPVETDGICT